ncbi:uncharacterized protein LOC113467389 [Diaphorina citri]|uniref:Uncharacterized protein LOC113467389 n=1 Tax=Diaphorina citri TaxID=121845 RepID=A0A3Q0IXE1_DIACI|nr:uncharacterized protein LOC113467389 [Diaphorina citri]
MQDIHKIQNIRMMQNIPRIPDIHQMKDTQIMEDIHKTKDTQTMEDIHKMKDTYKMENVQRMQNIPKMKDNMIQDIHKIKNIHSILKLRKHYLSSHLLLDRLNLTREIEDDLDREDTRLEAVRYPFQRLSIHQMLNKLFQMLILNKLF